MILWALILFSVGSFAGELFLPASVLEVTSETSRAKIGNDTIYRASVFTNGQEGWVDLALEKFEEGEYGSPNRIAFQKKFAIPEIPELKVFLKNKSGESVYGCCAPRNLKWQKGRSVSFEILRNESIFKHEGDRATYLHNILTTFSCSSTSLDSKDVKISCKKAREEKKILQ